MSNKDHEDELQYEKRPRAGLIPWLRDDKGELRFLMMVSSDPKFGGPRPMISKGKIEEGEDAFECAVREAVEELGLKRENLAATPELLTHERVTLRSGTYMLTLYSAPILERWDFQMWCEETEYTVWMSLEEFRLEGRRDHVKFLEMLTAKL